MNSTILLVEDDEPKLEAVTKFLRATFPKVRVCVERSLQSGVRFIRTNSCDIILLDMTLPNFDAGPDEPGGITHSFGGREFLRQMDRFDVVTPVILITQFETFVTPSRNLQLPELDQQLQAEHPKVYRGSVYYNASIHSWEEELKGRLQAALPDEEVS